MYDSMNFGLVSSSEIVLGGISSRLGISSSLLMSRRVRVHRVLEIRMGHGVDDLFGPVERRSGKLDERR